MLDGLAVNGHERLDVGQGEEDESELVAVLYNVEVEFQKLPNRLFVSLIQIVLIDKCKYLQHLFNTRQTNLRL